MNYEIMKTVICDDCMHGHHQVIGHDDCECVCHGNPQCWICGHNLIDDGDRIVGHHEVCMSMIKDLKKELLRQQ